MASALLFDTDVLVDYLRGRSEAVKFLESAPGPLLMPAIVMAELYAGVREGTERSALDDFILAFEIVPIDAQIARQGGLFRRDYGKSHHTGLADSLIAATATVRNARLVTLNTKHYPMLRDVKAPYRKNA